MHVRDMRQIFVAQQDKYLILDTHGGHQDVLGLVIALKLADKYERIVLGITCVAGRRNLEDSVRDALLAQQIAGTRFPVYKGSCQSLLLKKQYPDCVNFTKNFQTLNNEPLDESLKQLVQNKNAGVFIYQSIKKHGSQLSFISFGPLTNLALAFHFSQSNGQKYELSTIRINGGSYDGVGNVISAPSTEGNFSYDPEASHIVLTNYNNVYVNPIQRTLSTELRQELQTLVDRLSKKSTTTFFYRLLQQLVSHQHCINGPVLTVLGAFDRLITDKVIDVYSEVIRSGSSVSGMMAPNWLRLQVQAHQQIPNTKIYRDINRKILVRLLNHAVDE